MGLRRVLSGVAVLVTAEMAKAWSSTNIATKELVPIIAAAAVWGHEWFRQVVLFKCDNMAVVLALNSMSARDPSLNHLLTVLFFIEAQLQFEHKAQHVAGKDNTAADALSRNKFDVFISIYPQAPKSAVPCSSPLQELLFPIGQAQVGGPC